MPRKHKANKAPSELLMNLVEQGKDEYVNFSDFASILGPKAFAILMIICSAPLVVPIPILPGLTAIFGIPMTIFSFQMLIGKKIPSMPKFISNKQISRESFDKITIKVSRWSKMIEQYFKHRMVFLLENFFFMKTVELCMFVSALIIALPIPGANWVPSISVLLTAFGILMNDGLITLIGLIFGVAGIIICVLIFVLGAKIFTILYHALF